MKEDFVIYYAHPMSLYGTPQEERDIKTLLDMGFGVLNPAEEQFREEAKQHNNQMSYFLQLLRKCDGVAFRGTPGGKITCGVVQEIKEAVLYNMPIIELPSSVIARAMSIPETLEYLREIGER